MTPRACITGASGYLGGLLVQRLSSDGYEVVRLERRPRGALSHRFVLGEPIDAAVLANAQVLVHCAYDWSARSPEDIERTNVEGSRQLLDAAISAGVPRLIVLSSMSAYVGTQQRYGRAKLAIEALTLERHGIALRPGLVWGTAPGGMAGTLRKLARLPLIPVPSEGCTQFLVHEEDLATAVSSFASGGLVPDEAIGIAHPAAIPFRTVIAYYAAAQGKGASFLPIPGSLITSAIRCAEDLRVPVPFRSDSMRGLLHPAPFVPGLELLARLGVNLRPFPTLGLTTAATA